MILLNNNTLVQCQASVKSQLTEAIVVTHSQENELKEQTDDGKRQNKCNFLDFPLTFKFVILENMSLS